MTTWRSPRRPSALDLTPLIDVVFTLLMVVILGARFGSPVLDLDLPPSSRTGSEAEPASLSVVLRTDGSSLVDGAPVSEEEILGRVLAVRGDRAVVLEAEAGVSYRRVFPVLDGLTQAGVRSLSLAYAPVR